VLAGLIASLALGARPAPQPQNVYTLVSADGRRQVPFRMASGTDLVPLDDLTRLFGLTVKEDTLAGGLTVTTRGQRIVLTSGQSLASVGGRIVSLSGAVVRDGRTWYVPVDLLSRALGPALNLHIEVRRASHFIVVGDVRVPEVTARLERQGPIGRLTVDVQPPTPHHVTRDGNQLVIRFEADAIDAGPVSGLASDLATNARVEGASLVADLGPLVASFRASDDPAHFAIDLLPPGPVAPAPPPVTRPAPVQVLPPVVELAPSGAIRTVVIDAGHGGDDPGVRGPAGTLEKDVTLQIARRLKTAIESRIGLRVLLTRDADESVPMDRRTAFANNNQADLLISLHANASIRAEARGAEVMTLSLEDYKDRARALQASRVEVPVVGGGTRLIEVVPWDLAQLPHAARSAALGTLVVRHLTEQNVRLYRRPADQAPLRILAGANMPAVLIEVGFLSNADDERALGAEDLPTAIVAGLVATIVDVRAGTTPPAGGGGKR
jgi:N-acetylmuramoyl-L-alanine amidase